MTAAVATTTRTSKSQKVSSKDGKLKKKEPKSRIEKALVERAVSALLSYHNDEAKKKEEERSTLELLGTNRPVHVQFGLEIAPVEPSRKPIRILIPNPIHQVSSTSDDDDDADDQGLEEPDVCLIVKDESKPWVQEMIQQFKEHMGCVKKVLGLDSLRKKHSRYQQRRELLQKFDVFMADDRILPMLTSALGKDFIKAKKLPVPIRITRKEALPLAIQRNLAATYMTIPQGTAMSVRAGNTGMPMKKIVENVVSIVENAVPNIPRKWANIRTIAIKTPESTSLPFYHKLPEELLEIANLAGVAPAFKKDVTDKHDETVESPKRKLEVTAKSPFVRALKKQKKMNSETKEGVEDTNERTDKTSKKRKKQTPVKSGADESKEQNDVENQRNSHEKNLEKVKDKKLSTKSDKKKRLDESKSAPDASGEVDRKKSVGENEKKRKYISSKKYNGSKSGYVFRNGNMGVGYYIDEKPVVDPMVFAALLRAANQGGGKGAGSKRRKSGGKRKGRR